MEKWQKTSRQIYVRGVIYTHITYLTCCEREAIAETVLKLNSWPEDSFNNSVYKYNKTAVYSQQSLKRKLITYKKNLWDLV